jgi:hypothetical protein
LQLCANFLAFLIDGSSQLGNELKGRPNMKRSLKSIGFILVAMLVCVATNARAQSYTVSVNGGPSVPITNFVETGANQFSFTLQGSPLLTQLQTDESRGTTIPSMSVNVYFLPLIPVATLQFGTCLVQGVAFNSGSSSSSAAVTVGFETSNSSTTQAPPTVRTQSYTLSLDGGPATPLISFRRFVNNSISLTLSLSNPLVPQFQQALASATLISSVSINVYFSPATLISTYQFGQALVTKFVVSANSSLPTVNVALSYLSQSLVVHESEAASQVTLSDGLTAMAIGYTKEGQQSIYLTVGGSTLDGTSSAITVISTVPPLPGETPAAQGARAEAATAAIALNLATPGFSETAWQFQPVSAGVSPIQSAEDASLVTGLVDSLVSSMSGNPVASSYPSVLAMGGLPTPCHAATGCAVAILRDVDAVGNLVIRITDSSGSPVVGAAVTVCVSNTAGAPSQAQGTTDASGSVDFNGQGGAAVPLLPGTSLTGVMVASVGVVLCASGTCFNSTGPN